jgi:hypothetical protein
MTHADATINHDVQARDIEVMFLEGKLCQTNRQLVQALDRNDRLVDRLAEARDQVTALRARPGRAPAR